MLFPPPELSGMTEEQFNLWRHNPVTRVFLRFLEDQRQNWRQTAADALENGALMSTQAPNLNPHFIRGRLVTLGEVAAIRIDNIQGFYSEAANEESEA